MKIAITTVGSSLEDQVESRFGRAPYYLFVDRETMEYEAVRNPNAAAGGGAGIQSAQLMSNHHVQCVLTGNCGPNAYQVFNAAGIEVIVGISGTARQAIERFKSGDFKTANQPNVESHYGMGGGGGRGMGMGGGGRGMGMGGGGGRGTGMGGGRAGVFGVESHPESPEKNEAQNLEEEARFLEKRLGDIRSRINEINEGRGAAAVVRVDSRKCSGCGICIDCCPINAITLDDVAVIDRKVCTGCGICVDECPFGAITME